MKVHLPSLCPALIALLSCLLASTGVRPAAYANLPAPISLAGEDTPADLTGALPPSRGVSIVEVTGAPATVALYWLVPPAAPLLRGIALVGAAELRQLESCGAELRTISSYDETRFYCLVEETSQVSGDVLSRAGEVLWHEGRQYLLSVDADTDQWLQAGLSRVTPLSPVTAFRGPSPREAVSLRPEAAPAPLPQKFWIDRIVGSVSQENLLRHVSSLSGAIPVELSTGTHTIKSRYIHHADCLKAAEYIYSQFDSMGLSVEYDRFLGNYARCVEFVGSSGYVVGDRGTVFHTDDRGVTWEKQVSGVVRHLFRSSFVSPDTGWVVGALGTVLRTMDGGSSWTSVRPGPYTDFHGVKFIDARTGWVCGAGGIIYRTDDGGESWRRQSTPVPEDVLYDVQFADGADGWAVGYGGTILRTRDGGGTWEYQHSPGYENLYDACFIDELTGWAVGWGGTILRTSDGGISWVRQNSGVTGTLTGVSFTDSSNGWVVGWGGLILATRDGGAHWNVMPSGVVTDLYSVCFTDAESGWAVGMEHLLGSSDGGAGWSSLNGRLPGTWTNVVATLQGTTNPSETYVVCAHYDDTTWETPMVSAPGADDNASGASLVLEAARVLKDYGFESTVKFVCLTAEEMIYWSGSRHYATAARLSGEDIRGALNFDMVAWGTRAAYLVGNEASSELLDRCVAARDSFVQVIPVTRVEDDTWGFSDHSSFWKEGFSAICGIEIDNETNPYWHTKSDVVGRLDMTLATDMTKVAVASVASLAGLSSVPVVAAAVDVDPNSLNLKSRGRYVTCYVELPPGYPVSAVDVPGVLLNYAVSAEPGPSAVGDHDADGVPDLTLKFDRSKVQGVLPAGDRVEVSLVGEVGKAVFLGADTVRVFGESSLGVSSTGNGEALLAGPDVENEEATTGSKDSGVAPTSTAGAIRVSRLLGNYPQPFNPTTTIQYEVAAASHVCVRVFDLSGRVVRTLVDGEALSGPHAVVWNGLDDSGRAVASGVYVCAMTAGARVDARKMVLMR